MHQQIYQPEVPNQNNGVQDPSQNEEPASRVRGSRVGRLIRSWRRARDELHVQEWVSSKSYSAFRYAMVLLYIGTMLVVLGYHNVWLGFIKYVGLALVTFGLILTCYSFFDCFTKYLRPQTHNGEQSIIIHTVSSRVESADSKMGLPSYDIVAGFELPTYEEAEELRLYPDKIPEDYVRRLSLIPSPKTSSTANINLRPGSAALRRHSFPSDPTSQNNGPQQTLSNGTASSAYLVSNNYSILSPPPQYVPNPIFVVENSPNPSPLIVELHETLQMQTALSTSSSFEDLPEIHLSNGARPRFDFHPVLRATTASNTTSAGRRRLRSSSITPMATAVLPPSLTLNPQDDSDERLRQLRQSISARPQTSALVRSYSPVIESDDDGEISEVLEDVSDDDLKLFDESDGSEWDSGSKNLASSSNQE